MKSFYTHYEIKVDGGVSDPTVEIRIHKRISLYIPNLSARKKVVLKHDIHHLITGYSAFMKGETEISSWELSSGCLNNWVAFTINTYAMIEIEEHLGYFSYIE